MTSMVIRLKTGIALCREIKLVGRSGPLANFAASANKQLQVPREWHASEADIIHCLDDATAEQGIIIDLKPRVTGHVSL